MVHRLMGFALTALFIAGCGSSIQVRSDYDPTTDFSGLKTYQWMPRGQGGDALTKNPLVAKRVQAGVDKALAAKGCTLLETGTPDFYVSTHAGVKDKVNVTDYGYAYGGWWGPYGPYGHDVSVNYYQEATLFIDIIKKAGEKYELSWRGAGTGVVENRSAEEMQERIDNAAAQILWEFPPTKK